MTRLASDARRDLARLRDLEQTERLVVHVDQLDAVKYRFLTAIEGCQLLRVEWSVVVSGVL